MLDGVILALLLVSSPVASSPESASPYEVDWVPDIALLVGLGVVTQLSTKAVLPSLTPVMRCPRVADGSHCDPASVNRIDRSVIGNSSRAWARLSGVVYHSTYVIAATATGLMVLFSETDEPWQDWARDGLVVAIATNTAIFATHLLKYVVARPRPMQYEAETYRDNAKQERSFPSGETTGPAALCAAVGATFAYRFPDSPWRYAVAGAGVALTGLEAYGRVRAGKHFYSDVLAAAAVGGALGLLIPRAYSRDAGVAVAPLQSQSARPAQGLSLVFAF